MKNKHLLNMIIRQPLVLKTLSKIAIKYQYNRWSWFFTTGYRKRLWWL